MLGKQKKIDVDSTMGMVFCIYRAINDKERPGYGHDFGFELADQDGETLDGIVGKILMTCPGFYAPHPDQADSLNFLNRQIIMAMFEDIRVVLRDLAQLKLDHMLEEFSGLKEEIPESGYYSAEEETQDVMSYFSGNTESDLNKARTWFAKKDWKQLSMIQARKQSDRNKLARTASWMEGNQIDSRDYYDNIPHVSLQVIISELDQTSSFGSIEELIRHGSQRGKRTQSFDEKDEAPRKTISREETRRQLTSLQACLKKLEIESVALIAS